MRKWINRKRRIQRELIAIVEFEIASLEEHIEHEIFKDMFSEKRELLARLRIIKNNVGAIKHV